MDLNLPLLLAIITIITNLTFGLLVFLKNPKSITHRLITILTLILSSWSLTNYLSFHGRNAQETLFFIRLVMSITGLMFPTIFLLAKNYPFHKLSQRFSILVIIVIESLAICALSLTPVVFSGVEISPKINPIPGPAMPIYALHILFYLLGSILILITKLRRLRGVAKTQMRYLVTGIVSTFTLATITSFLAVILFQATDLVAYGPTYSLILISFITYAILKHRLLDINFIVGRAVAFSLVLIILAGFYAAILFKGLTLFPSEYHNSLSISIALFMAFSLPWIKGFIERLTIPIFYRAPYQTDVLLERIGHTIRSTLSLFTLLHGVAEELKVSLKPTSLHFFIIGKDNQIVERIEFGNKLSLTDNTCFNLKKITENIPLVIFDEIEEGAQKDLVRQLGMSVVMPLRVKEQFHGFLLLGDKASGNIYSNQDIQLLEILAPQLSVAVQNALSYEEINQFNQTLKQEVEKATTDLKKANEELKQLDKLKDEFVFVATHELKNPVTAMRGYLSLFQEGSFGDIPEKMKEPMSQLQASNQQLVELVNDLLQIARSEAETLSIHTEAMNLCPTIDSVIENLKPLANQKSLEIIHQCPGSIPQITADTQRVREILNNLLSNAIKYSEKGTITISHQLQTDQLITHVADQGVGISPANQKRLFTRFFRVEEEAAKGIPGTGLGLFVVKQLVEKMGGKIWVSSESGLGSTFSFSLPTA